MSHMNRRYFSRTRHTLRDPQRLEDRNLMAGDVAQVGFPAVVELEGLEDRGDCGAVEVGHVQTRGLGQRVDFVGDPNGDGYDDILVWNDTGDAILYYGSERGWFASKTIFAGLGSGFATGGQDVNGDGLDDFIIVSEGVGEPDEARLILGDSNRGLNAVGDVIWSGKSSAAIVPDLNGDGVADIVLGAHGEVSIVTGSSHRLGSEPQIVATGNRAFGLTLASVGDVNADGYSDFVVQDGTNVNIYFGGEDVSSLNVNIIGGFDVATLAPAGDFNGDGYDDVLIGTSTSVHVVLGAPSIDDPDATVALREITVSNAGHLGVAVSSGDTNGDGHSDIILGVPNAANDVGAAYVVFGSASPVQSVDVTSLDGTNGLQLLGFEHVNRFSRRDVQAGFSIAAGGDFNGDGVGDIAIGLPGFDVGNNQFGADKGGVAAVWGQSAPVPGDLNGDRIVDHQDVDLLFAELRGAQPARTSDVNSDGDVDRNDLEYLVSKLLGSQFGDADLDRDVDFADFLSLSANFGRQSGWLGGDFTGDRFVDFEDFLVLSSNFG